MMRAIICLLLALSLTAAVADEVTVTGRVVGPDGQPIEGAHVGLRRIAPAGEDAWVEATSAADGGFRLQFETERLRPRYQVVAVADGLAFGAASVEPGGDVEVRLSAPGEPITGTVVDANGDPIPGAEVTASLWDTAESTDPHVYVGGWEYAPVSLTGEDGRFAIVGLPAGARAALGVAAEGFARYYDGASENWPETGSDIEIVLAQEAILAGRVLLGGEPVRDIEVGAQATDYTEGGSWGDAVSDEDGRYEIRGLHAGAYNVALTAPEGLTAVAHEGVEVGAGARVDGLDFALIEGSLVVGTVTWADTGEAVADASIAAYGPAHPMSGAWVQAAETDEEGRYELRLPPGGNYVYWMGEPIEARGSEPESRGIALAEDATETLDFVLYRKPTIVLTVRNPDGTPAAGVPVFWDAAERYAYSSSAPEPIITDAEGQVELVFGRKREERVQPLAPALVQDPERGLAAVVIINGDQDREAEVTLQEGAWVAASARTADGEPIADMRVRLRTEQSGWGMDLPIAPHTDEGGTVRIGPLPTDIPLTIVPDWSMQAQTLEPSPEELQHPITLWPGETVDLPEWVIAPEGLSLRGSVVDAEGEPVAGATVVCSRTLDGGQTDARDSTGPDGRFELTRLATNGDHVVIAWSADAGAAFAQFCDPRIAFEPVFALMPVGELLVTVVDEGEPVPDASVSVTAHGVGRPALPEGLVVRAEWAQVDERGQVHISGLVPGLAYEVLAMVGPEDNPTLIGYQEPSMLADQGHAEVTIELMTRQEAEAQFR